MFRGITINSYFSAVKLFHSFLEAFFKWFYQKAFFPEQVIDHYLDVSSLVLYCYYIHNPFFFVNFENCQVVINDKLLISFAGVASFQSVLMRGYNCILYLSIVFLIQPFHSIININRFGTICHFSLCFKYSKIYFVHLCKTFI